MDVTPKDELCSTCRQIDFQTLYGGKRVDDQTRVDLSVLLGTGTEILVEVKARGCIFCLWILKNLEYQLTSRHDIVRNLGNKRIKLCCDGSTVYDGRESRPETVSGYLIPIVRLRVEPYRLHEDIIAELRLVKKPPPDVSVPVAIPGRILNRKTATIQQVGLWLNDCISTHEHRHDYGHPEDEGGLQSIPQFTLIRVHDRQLVMIENLQGIDPAYIALSYVWGRDPPTVNTGADGALPDQLPTTIEDALTLVSALESVPFLWVDSICIPLNEPEVRLAQIQKMDFIYDRAIATIITTGDSVSAGLTGISVNNNPSVSLQIGPYLLSYQSAPWKTQMSTHNNAASFFGHWGKRGWTFQEALITRRRIIMNTANDQIMFECSHGARQTHPTDAFEQVKSRFFTELDTVRREDQNRWNIHWYQHLLNLYLQRTLTYERDIISAFTGVARTIARSVDGKPGEGRTCWIIPRRDFLASLMWAPTKASKAVMYRDEAYGGTKLPDDGRRIPSWHWASVIMHEGIAFVQGSEPLQMYETCKQAWPSRWTDEEWMEVERTGVLHWHGSIVDFDARNGSAPKQSEPQATVAEPVDLTKDLENISLTEHTTEADSSTSAASLIDNRQCALEPWKVRRGMFLSCDAWAYAHTLTEVSEPLAIYPFATRLGNPKPMAPNRQFVLMVEQDRGRAMEEREEVKRVFRRVGWVVVDLDAWRAEKPVEEDLILV